MSKIKPCPVCGFDDDLLICWGKSSESSDREWFFYCMKCDYIYSCVAKSISEAIELWNKDYEEKHKRKQKK